MLPGNIKHLLHNQVPLKTAESTRGRFSRKLSPSALQRLIWTGLHPATWAFVIAMTLQQVQMCKHLVVEFVEHVCE